MDEKILRELEMVRKQGKGILYPETVVDFASDTKTALHDKFEWNDAKAGREYRIWQARHLIKVCFTSIEGFTKETPIYVSLTNDRGEEGGYRKLVDILSNQDLRKQLLVDSLRDLDFWQSKYHDIKELIPIFEAKEKVKKHLKLK